MIVSTQIVIDLEFQKYKRITTFYFFVIDIWFWINHSFLIKCKNITLVLMRDNLFVEIHFDTLLISPQCLQSWVYQDLDHNIERCQLHTCT